MQYDGSSRRIVMFFFSSRRRHTRSLCDWSSDVCSSDLIGFSASRTDPSIMISGSVRDAEKPIIIVAPGGLPSRSEERRVGKEWRAGMWAHEEIIDSLDCNVHTAS